MKIAVLGSGAWGTALAMLLQKNGHEVSLWSYCEEESHTLRERGENRMLPGVPLPKGLALTHREDIVAGCELAVFAPPSYAMRQTAQRVKPYLTPGTVLVTVAKGVEPESGLRMSEILAEELALRDANIMALQSQINPHFLNNTLEIINWEARMEGNDRVSSMIEALSTMLEATMDRKKQQMIPLSEEISYVEAYCYIIRQRFGEKFQFEKQIDPELLQTEVPRLIIQPIMENAVEHGLSGRAGKIVLRIYAEEDKLKIAIINDGLMSIEDKRKVDDLLGSGEDGGEQNSVSLGIRNVNKRLKIIYGPDCGLTIKNDKEECTVSTITVKLHK